MWRDFCIHEQCPWGYADFDSDYGPFMKFTLYGEIRDVTVAHLYAGSAEEFARMDKVEQGLIEAFGDKCAVFRAANRIIDVHAKGVSKARSARRLQQELGKKWLVCVGDGENDVSMLREADFAFSPADGVVADRYENVCVCGDGAVADVIFRKIPEIVKNRT